MTSDERKLIAECLAGDSAAFGQLVVRYQDRLYNALFRALGSAEDARDVSQETFVQAFQKLDSFRGESQFYTWLFRIALNAAASHRRKRAQKHTASASMGTAMGETPDTRPDSLPAHGLETEERQAAVQAALQKLAPEFRTPLVLREIDGLKYEEIAEVLACPIGTVRSRIHRARSELRMLLEPFFRAQETQA